MKIAQIGTALALSLSLIVFGCATRRDMKLQGLNSAWEEMQIERVAEQKILDKYRDAAWFFTAESEYVDKTIKKEKGYGNIVGKEYITVEHWIDKEIVRYDKGKEKILPLAAHTICIDRIPLEKINHGRDSEDRAIYKLPEELSWLKNNLEMKADVKLEKGDEVFWWGNHFNSFTATGKPDYREAKIAFLEGEYEGLERFIGLNRKAIPGDSGSLVVKKKTGEIVGVMHGNIRDENYGLVIPAHRYVELRTERKEERAGNPLFDKDYGFILKDSEWNEAVERAASGMK